MAHALHDPVRHNAWATTQLLEFCRRLDVLMEHAAQLATDWEVFLASEVDSERPLQPDEGTNPIPAGIVIAVVLYHGSKHRGQICTMLYDGSCGERFSLDASGRKKTLLSEPRLMSLERL